MMTPQQQQPHHHHTPPDMSPDVDDTLPRDFLVLWCIKYGLSERTESALRFHGYDKSSELLTLTKVKRRANLHFLFNTGTYISF